MISLSHGLWSDLIITGLIVAFIILLLVVSVKIGWITIGGNVETLEEFCGVVDKAYTDWDRDFDTGPSRLLVRIQPEGKESSGNFFRDVVIAYKTWNRYEPPRIGLSAFMEKRRPGSVIVSSADRPVERPFATFFPEGYPEKLIGELTLIEWRQRLQKRWPKAKVTMHYGTGDEPSGWRKQLEHAENFILDQQGQLPQA
jgi:hypothetical protein